jgi:hypothetical protein
MDKIVNAKTLKELIISGKFGKVKEVLARCEKDLLEKVLFEIGCDEESICAYAFVSCLIQYDEKVETHCLASELLNIAFPHLKGAYQTSLYHLRRAVELDPNDLSLIEGLLFFNSIPEKLISDEEARDISTDLIQRKATIK